LAETMLDLGRPDDAAEILNALKHRAPDHAGVLTALGRVYEQRGDLEKALALHTEAISADPKSENAYTNRGSAKRLAGDFDGALEDYEAALAINPTFSAAVANRGLALLTLGRLAEAWPSYRARIKALAGAPDLTAGKPWDGTPLSGKRVLVWLEYGLGDEILFSSLLPELLGAVAHCTIVCSPRLTKLFARSFPAAKVIGMGDPIDGDFDVRLPLTDVAQWLRSDLTSFPRHDGYLTPDETLVRELRRRYAPAGRELIVGISWRSASGSTGRFKSSDLSEWHGLLRVPGITFVSLQYGSVADELAQAYAAVGRQIIHDGSIDSAGDLDPFAAQVAAMDLIISVSNTTVHVAGALGRPVWSFVPRGPGAHWYWFLNRCDSPWYPSVRLFRQSQSGDWREPLIEATSALEAWSRR
jgi:tetratricopeptide (TPR) repeat protein